MSLLLAVGYRFRVRIRFTTTVPRPASVETCSAFRFAADPIKPRPSARYALGVMLLSNSLLENELVHIADPKRVNSVGDMPLT
jgi:hypothetical protein